MTAVTDNPLVIAIRSALFHGLSGLVILGFALLYPLIVLPRDRVWAILKLFIRVQIWLLRVVCGQKFRIIGAEHIPDTPCILASRHEALWETLVLPLIFDNPAVILKDSILTYPLAGPVARKLGFIGVDRSGSADRAKASFDQARAEAALGRNILIFPSGTRRPDQRDRVQKGVAVLYRALKLPCLPMVLDSGSFWPYRSWMRRPGTITIRIGPLIGEGLRTSEFVDALERDLAKPV